MPNRPRHPPPCVHQHGRQHLATVKRCCSEKARTACPCLEKAAGHDQHSISSLTGRLKPAGNKPPSACCRPHSTIQSRMTRQPSACCVPLRHPRRSPTSNLPTRQEPRAFMLLSSIPNPSQRFGHVTHPPSQWIRGRQAPRAADIKAVRMVSMVRRHQAVAPR
jgi:hypothetical protein